MKVLCEKGWEKPSPVQSQTIPAVLAGKDILARSKNGTGKTGAYVIPCMNQVDPKQRVIQGLGFLVFLTFSSHSCACTRACSPDKPNGARIRQGVEGGFDVLLRWSVAGGRPVPSSARCARAGGNGRPYFRHHATRPLQPRFVQVFGAGRGGQDAVGQLPTGGGGADLLPPRGASDAPPVGHVPQHGAQLRLRVHALAGEDQRDERARSAGSDAVLRLSGGAAEGERAAHALLQAGGEPVDHLLQQRGSRGAAGEEDHRPGLQLLLHPLQDVPGGPQSRLPQLLAGRGETPGVHRPPRQRNGRRHRQRGHQLRSATELRDLSASSGKVRQIWSFRTGCKLHHRQRQGDFLHD